MLPPITIQPENKITYSTLASRSGNRVSFQIPQDQVRSPPLSSLDRRDIIVLCGVCCPFTAAIVAGMIAIKWKAL